MTTRPTLAALPPHVAIVEHDDDAPLLVCRSPRHTYPRDYRARPGERGAECPLCLALDSVEAERRPRGDVA